MPGGAIAVASDHAGFDLKEILKRDLQEAGLEVLQVVDRAIERGFLAPSPTEDACGRCDFRPVCGPGMFNRVLRKPQTELADLAALRNRP